MKTRIKPMTDVLIVRTKLWEVRESESGELWHVFNTLREAEEYCQEGELTYQVKR